VSTVKKVDHIEKHRKIHEAKFIKNVVNLIFMAWIYYIIILYFVITYLQLNLLVDMDIKLNLN